MRFVIVGQGVLREVNALPTSRLDRGCLVMLMLAEILNFIFLLSSSSINHPWPVSARALRFILHCAYGSGDGLESRPPDV